MEIVTTSLNFCCQCPRWIQQAEGDDVYKTYRQMLQAYLRNHLMMFFFLSEN
jgi:hypothetical protein